MFSNKQLSELMEMSDIIFGWSDSLSRKMCLRFYCLIIIFLLHVLFLTCHCLENNLKSILKIFFIVTHYHFVTSVYFKNLNHSGREKK